MFKPVGFLALKKLMQRDEESQRQLESELLDSVRYGELDEVKKIINCLDSIADIVDGNDNTLIHYAAANGHAGILTTLLNIQGMPDIQLQEWVNHKNGDGNTALHWAVLAASRDLTNRMLINVIQELLAEDANSTAKNNVGLTPLYYAEQTIQDGEASNSLVDLLMRNARFGDEDDDMESDTTSEDENEAADKMSALDIGR